MYIIFGAGSTFFTDFLVRVNLLDGNWKWELLDVNNSYLRWGFYLNGEGNKYYAFGGVSDTIYNDLNLFQFEDNCKTSINKCITISIISPNCVYPPPRANHALIHINSFLYLFGGIGSGGLYSDMWQFDTDKETWRGINQQGNIPSARQLFAYSSFGDIFAIFGGKGSSELLNDLYFFNSLTNFWTQIIPISSSAIPSGRMGACAAISLPYLYIYGGETLYGISNELWQFNIGTNEFILLSKSFLGYAYESCQIVNNTFYIYYGFDSEYNGNTTIKMYSLDTNQWLPSRYMNFQVGALHSINIIIDGYFVSFGGSDISSRLYSTIYAETSNKTYSAPTNLYPFSMAYAYYKSFLYISGGSTINLYQQLSYTTYNPFFGYIDVNYTFQEITIPCSPGTMANGTICSSCEVGSYSEQFSNDPCAKCLPGTYLDQAGANSKRQCLPCSEGTFNENFGASQCLHCTSYQYCPIGTITPQLPLNISTSESIQPLNYDQFSNSILVSNIQLAVIILLLALAAIIIIVFIDSVENIDIYKENHNYLFGIPITLQKTRFGGSFTLLFLAYAIIIIVIGGLSFAYENINERKFMLMFLE